MNSHILERHKLYGFDNTFLNISFSLSLSMSKAIVSSDVGEVDDMIVDGESGFIVPVGDVDDMVDKIIYLINNPDERGCFGANARAVALAKLDLPVIANKHVKVYE